MAKANTATAKNSLDADNPTESIDKKIDMDALREKIRAEEAEKLRAESVKRQKAADARQAKLDAAKASYVEVVCIKGNVHTSGGKITEGIKKHIPEDEAEMLMSKGFVELA